MSSRAAITGGARHAGADARAPPQFGQRRAPSSAQRGQKLHSYEQTKAIPSIASGARQLSHMGFIARAIERQCTALFVGPDDVCAGSARPRATVVIRRYPGGARSLGARVHHRGVRSPGVSDRT